MAVEVDSPSLVPDPWYVVPEPGVNVESIDKVVVPLIDPTPSKLTKPNAEAEEVP